MGSSSTRAASSRQSSANPTAESTTAESTAAESTAPAAADFDTHQGPRGDERRGADAEEAANATSVGAGIGAGGEVGSGGVDCEVVVAEEPKPPAEAEVLVEELKEANEQLRGQQAQRKADAALRDDWQVPCSALALPSSVL